MMALASRNTQAVRYVIIGNSVAGIAAAQEIRGRHREGHITIVSDEQSLGYSRAMLPLYIAGKRTKRDLVFASRDFYASRQIRLLRGVTAESIDAGGQRVHLSQGKSLSYDRLLVATGSSSRTLDVPGKDLSGIFPLRKLADAVALKQGLPSCRGPVMIVGGGLVGVKSLEALAGKRKEIHLVISSDRILSQMLDRTASDFFLSAFEKHGIHVHLHTDVTAFLGRQRLEGVSLSDGTRLPCDLAIIGKGVNPNIRCLKDSGAAMNQGVRVDAHMATTAPSIFAAGDVAEPMDVLQRKHMPSTIWPSAAEGGRIAGLNMVGVPATFSGALRMNSVEILGVRVISVGVWEGGEQQTLLDRQRPLYRKLVHAEGHLDGFLLLGDVRCAGVLTSLVKNRSQVSADVLAKDLDRGFSYRPRLYALGGSIQVRQCGGIAG